MTQFVAPDFTISDTLPLVSAKGHAFAFPEDICLVAIGDVHGQRVGFERALKGASAHLTPGKTPVLVLTGDLIDRGPDSLGCVATGSQAAAYGFAQRHRLPGNHELLMLDALDEMDAGMDNGQASHVWLRNGGIKVLNEALHEGWALEDIDWREISTRVTAALGHIEGVPYRDAMRAAPSHVRFGDMVFIHAGIDPEEPFADAVGRAQHLHLSQERTALGLSHHDLHWAWVRYNFLFRTDGFADADGRPLLVVHGHTMAEGADTAWLWDANGPLVRGLDKRTTHDRICVDGAAARGALVAGAIFDSAGYRVFAAACC